MSDENEKGPEEKREELRQKELKNLSSSIHGSNLADLVGGLTWKKTGIIILVLLVVLVIFIVIK